MPKTIRIKRILNNEEVQKEAEETCPHGMSYFLSWSVLSLLIMMLIIIITGKIILKPEEKSTEKESSLIYEFDSEGFVLASDRLFAILSGEQRPKGWDELKRSFSSAGRLVLVDGNYYI